MTCAGIVVTTGEAVETGDREAATEEGDPVAEEAEEINRRIIATKKVKLKE